MEKFFVNNNFHYVHLVPISNGCGWTLEALCKQISTLYIAKDPDADVVVVWIDLERQECGSEGVSDAIREALISAGAPADRICICVPDRMTENAILADEELIRNTFGDDNYVYNLEGANGKSALKDLFSITGVKYKETSHGTALLKKVRLEKAAENSLSVAAFYSQIKMIDCWWLKAA